MRLFSFFGKKKVEVETPKTSWKSTKTEYDVDYLNRLVVHAKCNKNLHPNSDGIPKTRSYEDD